MALQTDLEEYNLSAGYLTRCRDALRSVLTCTGQDWIIPRVGHSRGQSKAMGFSGNLTPNDSRLPWASPPFVGFNSNKGLAATRASLSGQIILSVSTFLLWTENAELPLNNEKLSIWKCVYSLLNQSLPEFPSKL